MLLTHVFQQGGEVMFITYSDEYPLPDGSEFILVFEGSKQRHITTAQQLNAYTLRAIVPGKEATVVVFIHKYIVQRV